MPTVVKHNAAPHLMTRSEQLQSELAPKLSSQAQIILPSQAGFADATSRWQEFRDPDISVVVSVATESDIQQTILYAVEHDIPFLTMGAGHGATDAIGNVKNGIQIWVRQMNTITIAEDGQTAKIGPGALTKEIMTTLYAAGKQTTTGSCECTGIGGPALGGGHGWLQNRHGLVSDNLVEARMILANGTLVTVSPTQHADLFWAIRGAGHNFGIVTEFTQRIYDVRSDFYYEQFAFSEDKLEQVFTSVNKMMLSPGSNPPPELMAFVVFVNVPPLDPNNPILDLLIIYEGTKEQEAPYGAPFHALGPLNVNSGSTNITGLPRVTMNAADQPNCMHGKSQLRFPVGLVEYNPAANREVYNEFRQLTKTQPYSAAFSSSVFLFEGYSSVGVQAIPEADSAVPNRGDNLLVSPLIVYEPQKPGDKSSNGTDLDAIAVAAGRRFRSILQRGSGRPEQELHAYVNYAHGDETVEQIYGHEQWRIDRLRALKQQYDPQRRFDFYCPITG